MVDAARQQAIPTAPLNGAGYGSTAQVPSRQLRLPASHQAAGQVSQVPAPVAEPRGQFQAVHRLRSVPSLHDEVEPEEPVDL